MYGFSTKLSVSFDEAINKVTQALKNQGFGVLSDIDVQATLKARLGVEHGRYRILGACNPTFAHQALTVDPDIGLLLPCNVVVREDEDGSITVSFMDPNAVLELVERPEVSAIAAAVRNLLEQVRDDLVD
jgi:uncharacterized protein (DUF302 family)